MRILICVGAFEPSLIYGGQAAVAADHAFALARRGHEVTVLTSNLASLRHPTQHAERFVERDGVQIHYLPAKVLHPHFSAVITPSLRGWLRRELHRFDVAHIHTAREFFSLGCAAGMREARKPHVLQTHGTLHNRGPAHRVVDELLMRRALRGASAVIALQQEEERQLRAIEPAVRVTRLPNGIPIPDNEPQWQRNRLEAAPRIVFVARLAPVKRVLDLIEAASILAARGLKARYEIVGPDGGDLAAARSRVTALGLGEQIEFVGAVSREQALARLAGAAIHAQPSAWECFSLTTLEASRFGVPCVITTGNELSGELGAAGAAIVVEPHAKAFAAGLEQLLRDPARAESISRSAREWVVKHCALPVVIERLEGIYAGVIGA